MMKRRLFLSITCLLITCVMFACGQDVTTGGSPGEQSRDMDALPLIIDAESFLEHYERIIDVEGGLFITNMDHYYPVNAKRDLADEYQGYFFLLNECINNDVTRGKNVAVTKTVGLVSLLSNNDLVARSPFFDNFFNNETRDRYVHNFDYLVLNQLMVLDVDESIVDFSVGDNMVAVLTSENRVLTFGKNDEGQLLDGTAQVMSMFIPERFIDITGNFPLMDNETITQMSHYYFLTSKGRLFIRGFDTENQTQTIELYSDTIPLRDEETITDAYMTEVVKSLMTSEHRLLIDIRHQTSFTFEDEEIALIDDPGFVDLYQYLPLEENETVLFIETYDDGLVFFTDRPRVLLMDIEIRGGINQAMSLTYAFRHFDKRIDYQEGEVPVAIFKTKVDYSINKPKNGGDFIDVILTSKGRLFAENKPV